MRPMQKLILQCGPKMDYGSDYDVSGINNSNEVQRAYSRIK